MVSFGEEFVAIAVTFVGILFLYSGLTKLAALRLFVRGLLLIPHLPYRLARPIGVTVALLEVSSGGFLLANAALAKIVVIGLLALFAVVAIAASRNNQQVPCNCFGMADAEYLSTATARRNVLLASFLFVSFWISPNFTIPFTQVYALIAFLLFLITRVVTRNNQELLATLKEEGR